MVNSSCSQFVAAAICLMLNHVWSTIFSAEISIFPWVFPWFSYGFPINPPFSPRSPGFGSQNGAGLLPFDGAGRRGQARGAGGPAGGAAADHGGGASVGDVWERRKNWCINVYNIYISIYLSTYITYLPIYVSTYLPIYLSIYLFGYI